jgi:tetratricopeptide (TPR) repeat protein
MKTVVNISMVLVVLLSSTVLAAKQKEQKQPPAESKKTEVQVNTPAVEPNFAVADKKVMDGVVVTVNGTAITESQVEDAIAPQLKQMAGKGPENMIPQSRQQIRKRVIKQLVIEQLLAQEEKKNNIDVKQSELDQQINKQIAEQNLTLDEFKSMLKNYGTTYDEYLRPMRRKLMFDKLMETQFAKKLQRPTEEQLIKVKPGDSNDPNQAKTWYNKGVKLGESGRHQEALQCFESALKLDANYTEAWFNKGVALYLLGQNEEAINCFDRARSLNPSDADPWFLKGAVLKKMGRNEEATQCDSMAVNLANDSSGNMKEEYKRHFTKGGHAYKSNEPIEGRVLSDKQKEQIVMEYIQKIKAGADIKYTNEADKLETEIDGTKPASQSNWSEYTTLVALWPQLQKEKIISIGFCDEILRIDIDSWRSWYVPEENLDECIRLIDKAMRDADRRFKWEPDWQGRMKIITDKGKYLVPAKIEISNTASPKVCGNAWSSNELGKFLIKCGFTGQNRSE